MEIRIDSQTSILQNHSSLKENISFLSVQLSNKDQNLLFNFNQGIRKQLFKGKDHMAVFSLILFLFCDFRFS